MRKGWKAFNLCDVSGFQGGSQPPKSQFVNHPTDGYIRLLQIRDFKSDEKAVYIPITKKNRVCSADDIMLGRYGASVGQIHRGKAGAYNVALIKTIPDDDLILRDYFYYFLISDLFQQPLMNVAERSAQAGFSKKDIANFQIPVPPLPEQKRIVAILDEAFAAIDKAVANTEKNLANARELFDSYLENLSYEKQPLGKFVDIKTGKLNANAAVEGGQYPFFTCSREVYAINKYAFDCEAVLLAGNNASGDFNVKHFDGKFNAYQRTYVITVKDDPQLLYRFLYFQLIKSLKELKRTSIGTGTKFLKLKMIKDLMISAPNVEEQKKIMITLESLSSDTQNLESIYQQKLDALAELKQSILQKAFTGELTADSANLEHVA